MLITPANRSNNLEFQVTRLGHGTIKMLLLTHKPQTKGSYHKEV